MDIKSLREAQGLTLMELERRTGLKNSHISMVETHKTGLSDRVAKAIAPALGVKAGELIEAQALAALKHQAAEIEELTPEALKRAVSKDTKKAAAAVLALTEVIKDEAIPPELRKQASKAAAKLLALLGKPEATKSTRQPDRDLHGRKLAAGPAAERDGAGRRREAIIK
jgi:transcriptional regulator with XRE-family HTH domain